MLRAESETKTEDDLWLKSWIGLSAFPNRKRSNPNPLPPGTWADEELSVKLLGRCFPLCSVAFFDLNTTWSSFWDWAWSADMMLLNDEPRLGLEVLNPPRAGCGCWRSVVEAVRIVGSSSEESSSLETSDPWWDSLSEADSPLASQLEVFYKQKIITTKSRNFPL